MLDASPVKRQVHVECLAEEPVPHSFEDERGLIFFSILKQTLVLPNIDRVLKFAVKEFSECLVDHLSLARAHRLSLDSQAVITRDCFVGVCIYLRLEVLHDHHFFSADLVE